MFTKKIPHPMLCCAAAGEIPNAWPSRMQRSTKSTRLPAAFVIDRMEPLERRPAADLECSPVPRRGRKAPQADRPLAPRSAAHAVKADVCFPSIGDMSQTSDNHEMNNAVRVASASLGVVIAAAAATYVVVAIQFLSEWNWLWLVGVPLLSCGIFFRRSPPWIWPAAFAWLTICSFFSAVLTAEIFDVGL